MSKLDISRLVKDELIFEINSRGGLVDDTCKVEDMRSILRTLLSVEQEGKSFRVTLALDPKDELQIISAKIGEINNFIKSEITTTLLRKLETKICHVLNRLEKIDSNDKADQETKARFLTTVLNFVVQFNQLQDNFKKGTSTSIPVDLSFQTSVNKTSTPKSKVSNDPLVPNVEYQGKSDLSELLNKLHINEISEVSKWKLKFSGENEMGLNSFLERVTELAESRGITQDHLFKAAIEFFEGKALVFYRSVRDRVNNWESLCTIFKQEFLPTDYNDKLWNQIKNRTQGEKESVGIFVAYMNNLFKRLTTVVSDDVKLKIIRKNLLPFYQNQLILVDVHSIDELIDLCRKIDQARDSILSYIPPVFEKSNIESDLAYSKGNKKKIDNIEIEKGQVSFKDNLKLEGEAKCRDRSSESFKGENSKFVNYNRDFSRDKYHSRGKYSSKDRSRERSYSRDRNTGDFRMSKYRDYSNDRCSRNPSGDRRDSSNYRDFGRNDNFRRNYDDWDSGRDHSHESRCRYRTRDNSRGRSNDRFCKNDLYNKMYRNENNRLGENCKYSKTKEDQKHSNKVQVITCYKCHGKNHIAKDCKLRKSKN